MKFPQIFSPKFQFLIVAMASMLMLTGFEGGCGGSSDPEIERPGSNAGCPEEVPGAWDTCDLDDGQSCAYEEITCCDAEGGEGDSSYATNAMCSDGEWAISMAMIYCEHGYWPNNCSSL